MTQITDKKDPVIIVGAGIAGLSLAIQLTEKNIPCVVVEAKESFGGATTGVRISTKGVKVLEKMGVRNIGENTEKLIMYFGGDNLQFGINNAQGESPAIIVTRLAVFEKLHNRIAELGIKIIYNFKLENVIETNEIIQAISKDGQNIIGTYLVGADGVGSKVRRLLNPDGNAEKRYAGYLGIGFIYPSDEKIEMSLFNNVNGNIGLGSIGKIQLVDTHKNNFFWTHIHMSEAEAKTASDAGVYEQIAERAKQWPSILQQVFEECKTNPKTVLYHQPVYNGSVPNKWYSNRMCLIGDAAHPYGPGGQGISLALLDAEALCEIFVSGINEGKMANFQTTRATIAKEKGESAEERNKPENQLATQEELQNKYQFMMKFHQSANGKMEL
jgi:salicylate hydroxylase